jgi:predicted lipoprotein with Yx(FWY)xxD motif
MRRLLLLTLAITALAATGCGSESDSGEEGAAAKAAAETATTQPEPQTATTDTEAREQTERAAAKGTAIKLADSQYGKVLFDRAGQAIYLFDKEQSDRSECYDECAAAWPPVLTDGQPQAATGIDESLLGTTKRDDGATQVTYNGHPLYYYAHEGRNEVRCHNVPGFGGLWLALDREGNALG